jgi:hypothetical protein
MDAGLVPFYAFTSYIAYREVQGNTYGWNTLFKNATVQDYIVKVLFYATAACAGLHLISFVISIYLAVVFKQISKLPPDMNPLEDNLTARPSRRTRSEMTEKKHTSTSTLDSAYYSVRSHIDPVDIPEPIPFMHTRQQSSDTITGAKRASRTSLHSNRQSRVGDAPASPRSSKQPSTPTTARKALGTPSRPRSIFEDAPVLHPTPGNQVSANIRFSSPVPSEGSGNWEVYESADEDNMKPPSRNKNGPLPMFNGVSDWLGPVPRYGRVESGTPESGTPRKEARGQYAALETNYPHTHLDDVVINKDSLEEDITEYLNRALDPLNPLRMNPPTPQPKEEADGTVESRKSSIRRAALAEIANVNDNSNIATINDTDSPPAKESKLRTFGSLRLWPSKANKTTYASVQEEETMSSDNESDNNDDDEPPALSTPKRRNATPKATLSDQTEADRKGRVVSNSGIDLGTAFQTGMNSKQYGEYISGLGVGRRRDVSGKIAEEGRGGVVETTAEETEIAETPKTPEKKKGRAAGWARFAGL